MHVTHYLRYDPNLRPVKLTDPRIAIALHIQWEKTNATVSPWTFPEPPDYNMAAAGLKIYDCPFIQEQIFYRDNINPELWWSIYRVPRDIISQFKLWLINYQPEIPIIWAHTATRKPHPSKTLLHSRSGGGDLTENERLYSLGYYDRLKSKFSNHTEYLTQKIGAINPDYHKKIGVITDTEFEENDSAL